MKNTQNAQDRNFEDEVSIKNVTMEYSRVHTFHKPFFQEVDWIL